ncbi:hypothetical protein V7S43_004416 [Phytophthora oleae]|uniref:Uncharacterized protein n=1 Tax=Phytophthora oleae TaxID=2107226 RepID=A0ABD3FYQ2_9STRA
MVVNAGVMIREHFRKRLRLYVRLKFGQVDNAMTMKQKREKADLVNAILRACYSTEKTDLEQAQEMRDMLTPDGSEWNEQWIPWSNRIKENGMAMYVRLLWKFLSVVERRMEKEPNEKGVRAFTLFPVSSTYSSAHITLNGTTLAGFYSRIKDHEFGLPHIPVTSTSFKANRWEVLRHAFDIARFETRTEGCQVTTDGYSASVLLFRPKHKKETSSSEGPVVPIGYVPDVVVGLDLGMRSLVTAVCEDFRTSGRRVKRRRKRRRRRGGHHRSKRKKANRPCWIRRGKPPRQRNNRAIVQVTTREYRHLAGFNRFRAWNECLKKRHARYQTTIENMPSFKTASFSTYLTRLEYFWKHVHFLLQF